MAAQLLLVLFGAIVLGAAMLWVGLRGRRLNRNPTCRWCGFDLSGTYPEGVTCPECGAGLKRDKAVRFGQRRRMWVVATIGAGLIVLPTLGLGATVFAVLSGMDVNEYKPVGLLLWEGRHGGEATALAAAKEVLRRRNAGELSEAQMRTAVRTILDIQADPDAHWSTDWGDIIENGQIAGEVSGADYDRFATQAPLLEFVARPAVEPGAPCPIAVRLREQRTGSASQFLVSVWLAEPRIDGAPARDRRSASDEPRMRIMDIGPGHVGVGMMMLYGQASGWGMPQAGEQTVGRVLAVPDERSPGPAELTTACVIKVDDVDRNGYSFSWREQPPEDGPRVVRRLRRAVVNVMPKGAARVATISPSARVTDELAARLIPQYVWVDRQQVFGDRHGTVNMFIPTSGIDTPFAFDVFWRVGDREAHVGSVTSGLHAAGNGAWGYGEPGAQIFGDIGDLPSTGADLVFRPSVDLAAQTVDLTRIYGGEVVVEGVESENQSGTLTPSGSGVVGALLRLFTGG